MEELELPGHRLGRGVIAAGLPAPDFSAIVGSADESCASGQPRGNAGETGR